VQLQFTPGTDLYPYPSDCRGIVTLTIVQPDGTTLPIRRRNIKVLRRFTTISGSWGPPTIYASFGRQIYVRPVPDQGYNFYWDYWMYPTLTQPWANVANTPVMVPPDWYEIVRFAAVMRGHMALLERDKAAEIKQLLYGNPDDPNAPPGLIKAKILQKASENVDSEFAIRPLTRRYTQAK